MLQVSTLVPTAPSIAPTNAAFVDAGPTFSLALAGAEATAEPALPDQPGLTDLSAPLVPGERQPIAVPGSVLPAYAEIATDPNLAWIGRSPSVGATPTFPASISPGSITPKGDPSAELSTTDVVEPATLDVLAPAITKTRAQKPGQEIAQQDGLVEVPAIKGATSSTRKAAASTADAERPDDTPLPLDPAFVVGPSLAFFAAAPVVATPGASSIVGASGQAGSTVTAGRNQPAPPAPDPSPSAATTPPVTGATNAGAATTAATPASVTIKTESFGSQPSGPKIVVVSSIEQAARAKADAVQLPVVLASAQDAPQIGVAQPAARAFAAAIVAAGRSISLDLDRHDNEGLAPTLAGATIGNDPIAIKAPGAVDNSPLDTRREDWTRQLLDRIDALRDAADAGDTRIRLVPSGLGKIDVALRQQGDVLHVHFAADVPATRALLAEAQPRLAELAAERGLRLGQSGVDAGGQGQDQRRPPTAQQAFQPAAPPRAGGAEDDVNSDQRIA